MQHISLAVKSSSSYCPQPLGWSSYQAQPSPQESVAPLSVSSQGTAIVGSTLTMVGDGVVGSAVRRRPPPQAQHMSFDRKPLPSYCPQPSGFASYQSQSSPQGSVRPLLVFSQPASGAPGLLSGLHHCWSAEPLPMVKRPLLVALTAEPHATLRSSEPTNSNNCALLELLHDIKPTELDPQLASQHWFRLEAETIRKAPLCLSLTQALSSSQSSGLVLGRSKHWSVLR